MPARNSATASGGPCTKLRRWCRESRSDSTYCVRDGEVPAATSPANSRKKNFSFENPAAAKNAITVVENSGLTGSDGALRCVKGDARTVRIEGFDRGGCRFVLVPNFDRSAKRSFGLFD